MKCIIQKTVDLPNRRHFVCKCEIDNHPDIRLLNIYTVSETPFNQTKYCFDIFIKVDRSDTNFPWYNEEKTRNIQQKVKAKFAPLVTNDINDFSCPSFLSFDKTTKEEVISCVQELFKFCNIDYVAQNTINTFLGTEQIENTTTFKMKY